MPRTCFDALMVVPRSIHSSDAGDFDIPAFDANSQTLALVIELHPGQFRMLNYVVDCDWLPFRDHSQVIRWCVAYALQALLGGKLPSAFALVEAKMNILQDERFERQKDCLAESVQKYLAAGEKENARRLVDHSFEEYSRITNPYWRFRWVSTLDSAIQMLHQHGVSCKARQ